MIIEFFILIPFRFLSFLIGLLPVGVPLPSEIASSASLIGNTIGIFEPILPLGTLVSCLTILFSVQIALWSWKTLRVFLSHIPWIGGKG